MYSDNHHGDGRIALWCKAPSGARRSWLLPIPGISSSRRTSGTDGWLGIHLDKGLDWGVVAGLVKDGYLEAAAETLPPPAGSARQRSRAPESRSDRRLRPPQEVPRNPLSLFGHERSGISLRKFWLPGLSRAYHAPLRPTTEGCS